MNNDKVQHLRNMESLGSFIRSKPLSRKYECRKSNTNYIHYGDIHGSFNGFVNRQASLPFIEDIENYDSLRNGDLIFADASEDYDDLGKTVLIENIDFRNVVSGLHTHAFRPGESINPLYLKYYTDSHSFRSEMRKRGQGISVLGISKKEILKIEIDLPPKELQTSYSLGLRNIDLKIELLKIKIENLKLFKKGLTIKLITTNNKNCQVLKIKEFAKVVTGTTPSTKESKYYNGHIPWITPTDITQSMNIYNSKKKLSNDGIDKARKLPLDSLLVTCIASIGKNVVLKKEGSCNQQINAILPGLLHSNDFLYHYFEINRRVLESYAGNGGMKMLSKSDFENIFIQLPPLEEQKSVAIILGSIESKIEWLNEKLETYKQFKKGLLQQMFV